MAQYYTPVQSGVGNPKAHFGEEIFNPVLAELETLAYYQSGWYSLAAWTTLGSPSGIVTISGISQSWRHLRLMGLFRSSQVATTDDLLVDLNSGSGSDYYWNTVRFINSGTGFASGTAQGSIGSIRTVAANAPASHFTPFIIDIHNYQRTDVRSVLTRAYYHATDADAGMGLTLGVGEWRGTTGAISAINLFYGSNIAAGSMYALYGQDR